MTGFLIQPLPAESPFSAALIQTGGFPLRPEYAARIRTLLHSLLDIVASQRLAFTLMFQHEYLSNAKNEFSAHMQEWRPESGLGVWPDRPPPRLWKTSDLFRMAVGEKVPLMYRVFRITTDKRAVTNAIDLMTGSGMVMILVHDGAPDAMFKKYRDTFLPGITQPNLRTFPFYVPLLDVKSVQSGNKSTLSQWLGTCKLYIRESPGDKGIVLVSDLDLNSILTRAGVKKDIAGRSLY
jgi:hypothetical protein